MDWLEQKTQRPLVYWIQRVQTLIVTYTSELATVTEEKNGVLQSVAGHGSTNVHSWLHMLIEEVIESMPISGSITGIPPYDENMRVASCVGMILSAWYATVHQAKCFDPNRPATTRRVAYNAFTEHRCAMFQHLTEMQPLPTYFPNQGWDFPFSPQARNGDFL